MFSPPAVSPAQEAARVRSVHTTVAGGRDMRTLVVLGLTVLLHGRVRGSRCEDGRLDGVLAEYQRDEPPPAAAAAGAGRVDVRMALDVRHASVDGAHVRLLAETHLSWSDARLAWNESEWGCDTSLVPSERLWLPDVALMNAATAASVETQLVAQLSASGEVLWGARLDVSVPVALDLSAWPADKHDVHFRFSAREQTVDLRLQDTEYASVFETGAWQLVSLTGSGGSWGARGEERPLLTWTLQLRRRAPAHVLCARAVLGAAAMLLCASALLPAEVRGAACAGGAMLAGWWALSAAGRLPLGSGGAPRVLGAACALCAACGAAGACAALVMRVSRMQRALPAGLRTLLVRATPLLGAGGVGGAWGAASALLDLALMGALLLALGATMLAIYV